MRAHQPAADRGQPRLSDYDQAILTLLPLLIKLGQTHLELRHLKGWPALDMARRQIIDELGFGDEEPIRTMAKS